MPPTQRQPATPATPPTDPTQLGGGSLASALALLQSDLPKVRKGETATVPTKSGGKYTYTYADLADCSEALLPKLGPLGLSFTTKPTIDGEGRFVLQYTLRHASGENDSGVYPLPDPTRSGPQEIGSAITYARRYCLCAVTGLAPDDDDDGGAAAAQARASEPSQSGYDNAYENGSPAGNGEPPRNWLAEAGAITEEPKLLALGQECSAAGQFKGDVKTGLLKRRKEIQQQATAEPAAASPNGAVE